MNIEEEDGWRSMDDGQWVISPYGWVDLSCSFMYQTCSN